MPGPRRRKRRAVIIGGSMSGLFSAAFLRRIGWDVDVYERSALELIGRGAGITTHPELLDALNRCGAGTENLGIEVARRFAIDRAGRITGPLAAAAARHHRSSPLPSRLDVRAARAGRPRRARALQRRPRRTHRHAVGGDGVRWSVRGKLAPELQPRYAGYYIWRGSPNEADLPPSVLSEIFPHFVFYLPPRQQVITYPIAGFNDDLRAGKRRFNFIWYRVADAGELRAMNVDEHGVQHEFSVPPPLIRKALIQDMRADARAVMREVLVEAVMAIRQPFITPIYDFIAPRIVFGRVAMVGDAAANPRPHMGFGIAKAGGDAEALAQALADRDDIDSALEAYNAARQPIGNTIVLHARRLGTHLGVDLQTEDDRCMHKLLQDDGAMLDWIAVPNFLAAYRR